MFQIKAQHTDITWDEETIAPPWDSVKPISGVNVAKELSSDVDALSFIYPNLRSFGKYKLLVNVV